jgi:hypothetical protein
MSGRIGVKHRCPQDDPLLAQEILVAAGVDSQTAPVRRMLEDIFIEMVGAQQ